MVLYSLADQLSLTFGLDSETLLDMVKYVGVTNDEVDRGI